MKKILFLFGTRPEAIKMAPLIKQFSGSESYGVSVAVTAQHREMLDQVLEFFGITPDYDLDIMTPGQSLHQLTATLVSRITSEILEREPFDLVFVQGDTTTVLAGTLAAFYRNIPVAHIEAGLRSHNMRAPFPEEMNRVVTSTMAAFHFCPTSQARANLRQENIRDRVFVVGNTVIDALLHAREKVNATDTAKRESLSRIDLTKKIILVTCHRRENFGQPFEQICRAITKLAERFAEEVQVVFPVHLNPQIRQQAGRLLTAPNILLTEPLSYPDLIWAMDKSYLILTDSGGIQEEAPSLGKPVLVMRDVTERMEGVEAGTALLVGTDTNKIVTEAEKLLTDSSHYQQIAVIANPYGDGNSSRKIREIVEGYFALS